MFRRTVAPGIEMRLLETGDAKALYSLADRNRLRLRRWLPWVDQTRSPEDVRLFILRVLDQYHANLGPQTGVWVDGVLSGTVGCHPIDWANRNCSIGYWLDARQEGKGVMTRCCASLLWYGQPSELRHPQAFGIRPRGLGPRSRMGKRPVGGFSHLGHAGRGVAKAVAHVSSAPPGRWSGRSGRNGG